MHRSNVIAAAAAAVAVSLAAAPAALAERFVATDRNNHLYTFDDKKPAKFKRIAKPLKGLLPGERVVALDVRPATRQLIALTDMSRLYVVQPSKATATLIGPGGFSPVLRGGSFGFDFNPVVDRIRVVSGGAQNLRLNPDSGTVDFTDSPLRYKDGDSGAGGPVAAVASAYTNNVAGATSTTLYDIDSTRDVLAIQEPPNDGVLSTVGPLGVDLVDSVGFDISARDGRAYMVARRSAAPRRAGAPDPRLYEINLSNGAARQIGVLRGARVFGAFATLSQPAG